MCRLWRGTLYPCGEDAVPSLPRKKYQKRERVEITNEINEHATTSGATTESDASRDPQGLGL